MQITFSFRRASSRRTLFFLFFLANFFLRNMSSGWDYRSLRLNANVDPETYGRNIIDAFVSSTLQNPRVLALIDATKFSIFVSSFTAFLDTLLTLMQGNDVDMYQFYIENPRIVVSSEVYKLAFIL